MSSLRSKGIDPTHGGIEVVHIDLANGAPHPPAGDHAVFVVCWWRELPLGRLLLAPGPRPDRSRWIDQLAKVVTPAVAHRLAPDLLPVDLPGMHLPPGDHTGMARFAVQPLAALDDLDVVHPRGPNADDLTVIVCTRSRPDLLRKTLAALVVQRSPAGEVIVVDNGPDDEQTRCVVEAARDTLFGLRYVEEPSPGLSTARNAGIRAAAGKLIAFTDDDAEPHSGWTQQICRAFLDAPDLLALTGLVLPASLDSRGAAVFELAVGGFSQGYRRRDYDARWFRHMRWKSTPVWKIGAGANMAFRREAFEVVGGFDERLGAGAAGCSEDSELWYRLLASGHRCRYEPAAVVLHHHRLDLDAVRQQSTAYIEGHVAALFVQFSRYRHVGEIVRTFGAIPFYVGRRVLLPSRAPRVTARAELRGYVRGLRHLRLALGAVPPPTITANSFQPSTPASPAAPSLRLLPARPSGRRRFLRANPYPKPYTDGLFFREKMRAIHRVAADHAALRVLEIGGGRSGLTAELYPQSTVVSIDVEIDYGSENANLGHGRSFSSADATALPFPDACFDVVTFFDVLEHIEDDKTAVAEARRVLKPGGRLMVSAPNDRWQFPYYPALRRICPTDAEVMAEWGHVRRGYALTELDDLVGLRHDRWASFISPVTVLAHDVSFSTLRGRRRRALAALVAPIAWIGYALHRPHAHGTELAASWCMPDDESTRRV